jgi:hypothetical protein
MRETAAGEGHWEGTLSEPAGGPAADQGVRPTELATQEDSSEAAVGMLELLRYAHYLFYGCDAAPHF